MVTLCVKCDVLRGQLDRMTVLVDHYARSATVARKVIEGLRSELEIMEIEREQMVAKTEQAEVTAATKEYRRWEST